MRAVFLDADGLTELTLDELAAEFDQLSVYPLTADHQTVDRLGNAEVAITNKVVLSRAILQRLPALKLICIVATGTDVVDLDAAAELGITVCNCQAYGVDAVVQHTVGLMLALHTNLIRYSGAVSAGRWQQAKQFCLLDFPIIELKGKTLGIVGYGHIGRDVARIAEAFGMAVLTAQRGNNTTAGRLPLSELLPRVDVLSLHCPLTEQTRDLIHAEELALMKPGAFLINTARGGIVNEQALADALRAHRLAGAATDVLSAEPPPDDHPLLAADIPNLIITPHCAWGSLEARQRIIDQTVENVQAFKRNECLRIV